MMKLFSRKPICLFMLLNMMIAGAVHAAEQPNILFILADDLTWEGIGLVNSEVHTPNLDKLVENGVSFDRAYNMGAWQGAVCIASRTMLNSGRSIWTCQSFDGKNRSVTPGKAWSQLLGDAGYKTYFAGKWHVKLYKTKNIFDVTGTERPGMPNQTSSGYNRPVDENDKTWLPWDQANGGYWQGGTHWSEVLRDEAVGFIDQAAKEKDPFFMYLAFNAPHDPRQSPKEYVDMYPPESITVPENFLPEYPYKEEMGAGRKLRDERLLPFPRTEYAVKVNRAEYYALITHMDEQIGQILDALEKSGKADNTYIFFTADHGLALGHHGLAGKQNMYEHSLGAPIMVSGPGLEKGRHITERVYIQDIVPSTLELAGAEIPEEMYFKSLMPLIRGEATTGRDVIYGAYQNIQRAVVHGDWKLIYYPKASKYRLFNLAKDPLEMKDLSENPEFSAKLDEMKTRLSDEMENLGDSLTL